MSRLRARLLASTLLFLGACRTTAVVAPPPPPPTPEEVAAAARPAAPIHLTIFGGNDLHGWVFPTATKTASGVVVEEGGLSVLAGYLAIVRKENPGGVIYLDAGDLFQGTLAANLTEGSIVIDAYNRLEVTAAAIGNHEFDYGPVGPMSVASSAEMDPFGALKARISQAKFPLLGANIYEQKSGDRPAWLGNDGTVIVDRKGVKVGIIGLVTPSTPVTTNPVNVATLKFASLAPEAVDAAKRLRAAGADLVLLVAHAGGKCADISDPRKLDSCDLKDGEIFDLLQNVPEGTLDAVIAGHTHGPMGHYLNGTPVLETWGLGKYFGLIDLYVDPKTKKLLKDKTVLEAVRPVCEFVDETLKTCEGRKLLDATAVKLVPATFHGQPVVRDRGMDTLLAPAGERVRAEETRALGLTVPAVVGRNYEQESALGSLLADTLREAEGADVALLNSGGLRADLPAGALTYGHVYNVLPFDNSVATVVVTGEELKRLLNAAYGARKGVFQQSGLLIKLAACPGQGRLKSVTLANGKPLVADRKYRVAVPDFLARGGDGLGPVLQSLPPGRINLGERRERNFRDELVAHWVKKPGSLVAPKLGRLAFVDDPKGCNAGEKLDRH